MYLLYFIFFEAVFSNCTYICSWVCELTFFGTRNNTSYLHRAEIKVYLKRDLMDATGKNNGGEKWPTTGSNGETSK